MPIIIPSPGPGLFVKMLDDARPASRSDGLPFTIARLQEAPDITGAPTGLVWTTRTSVALATGVATPALSGGVTPLGLDADPSVPGVRDVTTSVATIESGGWYRVLWEDASGGQDPGDAVQDGAETGGRFASVADVAVRLAKTSADDFTDSERVQADLLLTIATGLIVAAVDRDEDWAARLSPVPTILRAVCLEMVARVMLNPKGARSEAETIGQYSHSASFTDNGHGLLLTAAERMLCRRAAIGATSGSACVESVIDKLAVNMPVPLDTLLEAGPSDPLVYDWTDV